MAYTKNTWVDRDVQYPNRYKDQNNNTLTLTRDEGTVNEAGTLFNAAKMNNIEDGIEALDTGKVNKTDIVDNLTTNDETKTLSAKQGKVLNDKINELIMGEFISNYGTINYGSYIVYNRILLIAFSITLTSNVANYNYFITFNKGGVNYNAYINTTNDKVTKNLSGSCYISKYGIANYTGSTLVSGTTVEMYGFVRLNV